MSLYNTIKSFKGISIYDFLKYAIIVTTLVTLYVKFIPNNFIKDQEKTLSTYDLIKLYANRFVHIFLGIIATGYPFLVEYTIFMDIIYILYSIGLIILWHWNSECVLSVHEKQILDPCYKKGENIYYQPYVVLLSRSKTPLQKSHPLTTPYILLFYVTARTIYNILHKK